MTVGPTVSPAFRLPQASRQPSRPAEADLKPGPFAQLLLDRGASSGVAEEQFTFRSSGRDFQASASIGEDAIRFDARPVVAPGSVDMQISPTSTAGDQAALTVRLDLGAATELALIQQISAVRRAVGQDANYLLQIALAPPAVIETGFEPAQPPRGISPSAEIQAMLAPAERSPGPRDLSVPEAPAPSSLRSPGKTVPPASLALLAQEVLITVRGLALSPSEIETLLNDVRQLLAANGIAERTVRISMAPRSS